MNFGFTEDQDMIRKSAKDFVSNESSIERVRAMFTDATGYSEALWAKIAENGWCAAVLPEEYGGIGLGYSDLICIAEEFGKGLMPEPLIQTSVLGGNAILFAGTDTQKEAWLPEVASGALKLALGAYEEAGRSNLAHVETTATASNGGYVLNGSKFLVQNAATADKILITARTSGPTKDRDGVTLFVLDKGAKGLTVTPVSTIDHHPRSTVTLKNAQVGADAVVGSVGEACDAIERAVDGATVALCAEMVGGMQAALSMTVQYSHERIQFGVPIGTFQALKHKAANMYMTIEIARSSMYYAAMAADQDMPDRKAAISAAKALCSDGYVSVAKEAIQMHGGIGFTDEHNIGLFYKRAIATAKTYGDARYHRDRYAAEKFSGKVPAESAMAAV